MNFILSLGVISSVFVSVIYGQYYPHRTPFSQKQQPYIYKSANDNPFQKAYENEGYYQRFTDYGNQRSKPLTKVTQRHNTYSNDNKGKGKDQQNHDSYEDNEDFDFGTNLDYNDVTQDSDKDFDPFKFVNDGVAGVEKFGDIGNLGDFGDLGDSGDHFDYNVDYNSE